MNFLPTPFPGLYLIEPKVYGDHRGYFFESFQQKKFDEAIGKIEFVQDNESKSGYGVLRGLHFQRPPFTQAKLVRCITGAILDVVADLRRNSPTFKKTYSIELSGSNKLQLFIPRGFAHGFVVLSEEALFSYKVDNFYSLDHDAGILYDDPELLIDWVIPNEALKLSEKDRGLPLFSETVLPFSM
ncbi:MAG: dTDP-4-dehydrorhamnose 3,5-epimerase [Prolixibacteraceae bacterium]|jgi:dTDP-4-dehydrorhamnose 3,5-epimerase|nr:dTDP-4-dehydrorhamnose 3,5-epimerase [Prolixibacteraceae bacterium]